MQVNTVSGAVSAAELGITLTHEHVLVDLTKYFAPDPDPAVTSDLCAGVQMSNLGYLRQSLVNCLDDLSLSDDGLAEAELMRFCKRGGRTVCDVSTYGIRVPDQAQRLRRIAEATGLQVILGTGAYIASHHPSSIATATEDELLRLFAAELSVGTNAPGVPCGFIGEIGVSSPPTESEWRVVRASARAHLESGAPIIIHQTDPSGQTAHSVLDQLSVQGVELNRVAIAHMGIATADVCGSVLRRGSYIAIDTIGLVCSLEAFDMPTDRQYRQLLLELDRAGWSHRVLLSHDVCHKRQLRAYGGVGYDHLLTTFMGMLELMGVERPIERYLIRNVRAFFGGLPD